MINFDEININVRMYRICTVYEMSFWIECKERLDAIRMFDVHESNTFTFTGNRNKTLLWLRYKMIIHWKPFESKCFQSNVTSTK